MKVSGTRPELSWHDVTLAVTAATLAWFAAALGFPLIAALAASILVVFPHTAARRLTQPRQARTVPVDDVLALQRRLEDAEKARDAHRAQLHTAAGGLTAAAELTVRIEEDLRATIVADLHDTVTQTLIAASYATYDETTPRTALVDMMRTAEKELREVMVSQSPLGTRETTLADLVQSLCARLWERRGLRIEVSWPEHPVMTPYAQAVVIYRFIHETLHNVAKHAGVETAWVEYTITEAGHRVEVRDRGAGFDPSDTPHGASLGLELLRSRCRVVGAQVDLESAPGHGTQVSLLVPHACSSS